MDITDLCKACGEGNNDKVEEIMAEGQVDVNGIDGDGRPPLIYAVMNEHPSTLSILLASEKTRLDVVDGSLNSWTALHWACWGTEEKQTECLKQLLLDNRCTPDLINKKNDNEKAAIWHAVFMGNLEAAKLLSDCPGIDMDTKDDDGNSLIDTSEERCNTNFVDESQNQIHIKILAFLKEKMQGEGDVAKNTPVSLTLKEIVDEMDVIETTMASEEEKYKAKITDLEGKHKDQMEKMRKKLKIKREELKSHLDI